MKTNSISTNSNCNFDSQINLATQFDISTVLNRFMIKHSVSETLAKEYEIELKRYLVMCSHGLYGMAGMVDELWHEFVLHTKLYSEFCNTCLGEFIHHVPHSEESIKGGNKLKEYKAFLDDYLLYFNHEAPMHIWPDIVTTTASDIGNCNACGNDPNG